MQPQEILFSASAVILVVILQKLKKKIMKTTKNKSTNLNIKAS